jgi:hypothetical protein
MGNAYENNFVRIKILTEEGRKYADVEIPYDKSNTVSIDHISARTVHPDGSVSEFKGKPFNKSIVKAKGLKYMAKTFTLPDVQVGSIIEYFYVLELNEDYIFDSHWILNDELFTKHAKFSLKPYTSPYGTMHLRWSWHLLPAGSTQPTEAPNGVVRMEVNNVPAFQSEDYMPPANELKSRVDFTYSEDMETDSAKFWKNYGKKLNSHVESFTNKRKAMEQAVAQIVSPNDAGGAKLQKKSTNASRRFAIYPTSARRARRSKNATNRRKIRTWKTFGNTAMGMESN